MPYKTQIETSQFLIASPACCNNLLVTLRLTKIAPLVHRIILRQPLSVVENHVHPASLSLRQHESRGLQYRQQLLRRRRWRYTVALIVLKAELNVCSLTSTDAKVGNLADKSANTRLRQNEKKEISYAD